MLAAFLFTAGMLACVPARRRRQLTGAGVLAHIGVSVCQGSPVCAALAVDKCLACLEVLGQDELPRSQRVTHAEPASRYPGRRCSGRFP
jgi:hypothetical protein